ncbi:hypothetical protein N8T08_003027 [Aspergillus melleus]|uniref:Uncharacterized protein n=1 Tax=Aspergillus melleus TaxID=138277 RepID=A0ACC3B7Q5_9EURO|nr:hypothetical protein N8T08_003027 [Aspergillus melleus]
MSHEKGSMLGDSSMEVKRLRDRLAHYENHQSPLQTPDRSLAFPVTTNNVNGDSPVELPSPAQILNDSAQLSPVSIIQPEPCLSSNNIFGSRIQSLLQSSGSKHEGTNANIQGPDAFKPHILNTLTEPESRRLLAVVVFYIGQKQHHFDIREFSDRLGLYFADPQHVRWQNEPWLLEMMLVLAVGKLFAGDFDEGCDTPGSKLFDGAHKSIPTLTQLITHQVLGVEILALSAVYLQNLHRKDEAYFYV